MKLSYVLFAGLLAGIVISACNPVPFDGDIEESSHKITLNAYFIEGDSAWSMNVSQSYGMAEPIPLTLPGLTDASISIYEEDNLITTITNENQDTNLLKSGYYYSKKGPSAIPKQGKTYAIQINHSTLGSISASCQLPMAVPITSVEKLTDEPDANGELLVDIYFQDPGDEENYYELVSMYKMTRFYSGKNKIYTIEDAITTSDPIYTMQSLDVLESTKGPVIFSDKNMNGKLIKVTGTMRHTSSSVEIIPDTDYVILRTVSKDYYLHQTTEQLQQLLSENPFAQPVQVYSNVKNGFGIFAGYSKSLYKLP